MTLFDYRLSLRLLFLRWSIVEGHLEPPHHRPSIPTVYNTVRDPGAHHSSPDLDSQIQKSVYAKQSGDSHKPECLRWLFWGINIQFSDLWKTPFIKWHISFGVGNRNYFFFFFFAGDRGTKVTKLMACKAMSLGLGWWNFAEDRGEFPSTSLWTENWNIRWK